MTEPKKLAAIYILRQTLEPDCPSTLADELVGIAIKLLEEET